MLKKIKDVIYKLVLAESSPVKLTVSFCLGTFIALSPIIPLQTPLIFVLSWLLRLNTTVVFITVYLINNPLTLVPIYVIDYLFGVWFFHSLLKMDLTKYNPYWIEKFNNFIIKYVDLSPYTGELGFCFWCLILGGLILAFIVSVLIYPIMKKIFIKLLSKIPKQRHEQI